MNYFEFFGLDMKFHIDESSLKKVFRKKSKELHPDFHTDDNLGLQDQILKQSAFNNEAYGILSEKDKRIKYILELNQLLGDESKHALSKDFLASMMDINEVLMELDFDLDPVLLSETKENVLEIQKKLLNQQSQLMQQFDDNQGDTNDILKDIKDIYLKNKYLLRIQEKINTFASQ